MLFDNNSAIGLDGDFCLAFGVNLYGAECGFGPQTLLRWFVVVVGGGGAGKHGFRIIAADARHSFELRGVGSV